MNEVEDTLNKIRSGGYVTRPQWEDLYTSMAKPPENQPVQTMVSALTLHDCRIFAHDDCSGCQD